MKVFLIVVGVIVLLISAIMSLSATITIIHDKGWTTRIKVLWIEKDIVLSEVLSFILFPEKKAKDVAEKGKDKKSGNSEEPVNEPEQEVNTPIENKVSEPEISVEVTAKDEEKTEPSQKAEEKTQPKKPNPIMKIWQEEGIVGILSLLSNVIETANSAILTLFRGLHIYSLYVMILVGGGDADVIARRYGTICKYYYPIKGIILNGMKVDNYDDYVQPDFIADHTEFEMQFIASISVGLLTRMLLKAGIVFLKNLIINKKGDK